MEEKKKEKMSDTPIPTKSSAVDAQWVRATIVESFRSLCPSCNFISFPFKEGYHLETKFPRLSRKFTDDRAWLGFVKRHLNKKRLLSSNTQPQPQTSSGSCCEIESLPSAEEIPSAFPFPLTQTISIQKVIFRGNYSIICVVGIKVDKQRAPSFQCVVKITDVLESCSEEKMNRSRYYVSPSSPEYSHIRCCPAWSEPIATAKACYERFYGNATFYCKQDRKWYSAIFMPLYTDDFHSLAEILLTPPPKLRLMHKVPQVETTESPLVLLAHLMQIIFYVIPKYKSAGVVCHNDLKLNNVTYENTTRKHVYVAIKGSNGKEIFLSIPTYGRAFRAIDFGWSSIVCEEEKVMISSVCTKKNYLEERMRAWNLATDYAQLGHCLWQCMEAQWGENPYSSQKPWWKLLDATLMLTATDDGKDILRIKDDNWDLAFYTHVSKRCHFRKAKDLIKMACSLYRVERTVLPQNRKVFEFDLDLLL